MPFYTPKPPIFPHSHNKTPNLSVVAVRQMSWKLYYDSDCTLCSNSRRVVEEWANRSGIDLQSCPLQSEEARHKGYKDILVLEANRVYYAEEAWLKMMSIGPWYFRWLSYLCTFPFMQWLPKRIYNWIARNRCNMLKSN